MKNKKKTVIAYTQTHWDREWYREFEEFRTRLIEVFDDVLEKLESDEIPSFYFDGQTAALEDYLEIKPEKESLVKKLITQKKLFIGPFYCSTDSFLVDCESLIKNLQLGIGYSKKFGCNDYIAYHADTFGHSSFIPQIIKYFDIKNSIFWRGLGELDSEFLFRDLKATYLIQGYFHDYFTAPVSIEKKVEFLKNTLDKISKYSSNVLLLPLGGDHLGIADNLEEQIKQVNKHLEDYEIILSNPFDYLKRVENNYKKNIKHEFRDTKRNFILPGVLSSRLDLKRHNTQLQWELSRITQPLQAIFGYLNLSRSFQDETDYAYKLLLQNHPHDSIYGCSVDAVHKENLQRYEKTKQVSSSILNSLKRDIFDPENLSVINMSNHVFSGALKISTTEKLSKKFNAQLVEKTKGFPLTKVYDIRQVPITEDYTDVYHYLLDLNKINSFSIKNITEKDINTKNSLKITENSIENEKISLSVKNGKIEIKDKINNKIYKNVLKIKDRADVGDSYNFGALKGDKPIYTEIIGTKIKEKGHIRSILEITFEIKIPKTSTEKGRSSKTFSHLIKIDVVLENQNDYLEFDVNWQNKSLNHILQVEFSLPEFITQTVSDDLAGYTKRDWDYEYDIYKNIPAPRGIELKHNLAPMQKCVIAQGFAFITEGLTEYEIFKKNLSLTLLRATGTISNPHNPTRGTPAGPPLSTPDLQMTREQKARFALCFKDSIKDVENDIEKFYGSALLFNAKLDDTRIVETNDKDIVVSTIKSDKEGNILIRFLNKSNKEKYFEPKIYLDYKKVYYTNALEEKTKEFIPLPLGANSFVTICIKK